MQNNIDYWKRRQIREAFNVFSQAEIAADEIAKLYLKASAYMTAKMQGVYDKFKRKYGLTDEQAKQLLAVASDRGSIDAALQALKNSPQTEPVTELRKVVESAAYAARIRQIRELEISAGQVMNAIYKQELAKNTALYQKLIPDSYRKSIFAIQQRAGIAFSFSDVNPKLMDRLLHSKWSGKNYSVRLWGNTQEVAENVKEQIILGALTGKTEREMAEALDETFAKGAIVSRRLIRTESNYIFTQADMAARKECDIRRYMYLATLDMKTCAETCGKLDGRIFLVKDQKPGYNCPPMHPWCRCTTLAILSDEWIRTQTRRARDPETGRTYKVPLSMTYGEWKKKYLDSDASKPKSGSEGKENDIENYLRNNLPSKKSGFTDTRNVGEYISKQDLAKIKEKAQSYGIRMGADEHSNGNFELYRGDPEVLENVVDELGKQISNAKANHLFRKDDDVILNYDNVLGYEGDDSKIDVGAFAMTKGKTITLNKFMYDDSDYLKSEYESAVKLHLFPQGTTYRNVVVHEFGHIIDKQNPKIREKILNVLWLESKNDKLFLEKMINKNVSNYASYTSMSQEYIELLPEIINAHNGGMPEYANLLLKKAGVEL